MRRPSGVVPVNAVALTTLLATVIVAVSVPAARDSLAGLSSGTLWTIGAFMAAIALGETTRLTVLGRRETAPMATAAALALAMTTMAAPDHSSAPFQLVILATAVAMAVGVVVQALRGQAVALAEVAASIVGIAVAAGLYRGVDFADRTLLEWQEVWADRRWIAALAMLAVSSIAMLVELTLVGAIRAERDHSPLLRTVADALRSALGLTTALVTTGALIALAETALGLVALPLFLFPLLLAQFAVRRYSTIRETYRETIGALSSLTERAGYTRESHASRVASLAVAIGRDLGMPQREVTDLEYAALLHDLGQVALREPIPGGATVLAAPSDQQRIAHDSAEIVRRTGVLETVATILEAQTKPYRQVREFGEDLPMASRIIKVVNAYDDLSDGQRDRAGHDRAMERIHLGLGYEYDPRVVDSLSRVLARRRVRELPLDEF